MAEYKLSPRAKRQMRDIWRHIAAENEPAADRLLKSIFEKCALVATYPEMGSARPELNATARIFVEGRYIAIDEPTEYGAEIVAVVHGMREPSSWLE